MEITAIGPLGHWPQRFSADAWARGQVLMEAMLGTKLDCQSLGLTVRPIRSQE